MCPWLAWNLQQSSCLCSRLQCWDHKGTAPCWLYLLSHWRHVRRLLLVADLWRFSVGVPQLSAHCVAGTSYLWLLKFN